MDTNNTQDLNTKLSAIDKALAAAKARKAAKEGSIEVPNLPEVSIKKDDLTKAQKVAEREAKRLEAARLREERRAQRAAEKAAKSPAHMKKLNRAASKLPSLGETAQSLFNEITANYSREQITAIAMHLQHFNRAKATERALNQKLTSGLEVRIIGGDPKYVGQTGTISKAQRIRCYVTVPGFKRDVYCFTSDVEVVVSAAKTGTNG